LAATLRVLVTSRAALRVRGEREYAVGPLALEAGVDTMSPADLARSSAVRLFVERVRDVQPDFHLTPANGPTVTAICRRLDALPLALELAARWIKVLTPDDLLGRLTRDALLSTAGPRDLPERQRTMNATVAWSYQLLSPDEQRVFRRLGALPGRFSIDAAAAVLAGSAATSGRSEQVLSALADLIDKDWPGPIPYTILIAPGGKVIYRAVNQIDELCITSDGRRIDAPAAEELAEFSCQDSLKLISDCRTRKGIVGESARVVNCRGRDGDGHDTERRLVATPCFGSLGRPRGTRASAWGGSTIRRPRPPRRIARSTNRRIEPWLPLP
jgi:hypothetical protein